MSVNPLVLLLIFGAIARIVRFFNSDALAQGIRDRAEVRFGPHHKIVYLIGCPWCASMWVAPPVTVSGWLYGASAWWQIAAFAMTASYVYGLLSLNLDEE
jgi:hypothetical protein